MCDGARLIDAHAQSKEGYSHAMSTDYFEYSTFDTDYFKPVVVTVTTV